MEGFTLEREVVCEMDGAEAIRHGSPESRLRERGNGVTSEVEMVRSLLERIMGPFVRVRAELARLNQPCQEIQDIIKALNKYSFIRVKVSKDTIIVTIAHKGAPPPITIRFDQKSNAYTYQGKVASKDTILHYLEGLCKYYDSQTEVVSPQGATPNSERVTADSDEVQTANISEYVIREHTGTATPTYSLVEGDSVVPAIRQFMARVNSLCQSLQRYLDYDENTFQYPNIDEKDRDGLRIGVITDLFDDTQALFGGLGINTNTKIGIIQAFTVLFLVMMKNIGHIVSSRGSDTSSIQTIFIPELTQAINTYIKFRTLFLDGSTNGIALYSPRDELGKPQDILDFDKKLLGYINLLDIPGDEEVLSISISLHRELGTIIQREEVMRTQIRNNDPLIKKNMTTIDDLAMIRNHPGRVEIVRTERKGVTENSI